MRCPLPTMALAVCLLPAAIAQAQFFGLGDLPGGQFESQPWNVSNDGSVIVGWSDNGTTAAFRWSADTGMLALTEGHAVGVDTTGSVIVGVSGVYPQFSAWRWTAGEGVVPLGALEPGGYAGAWAVDGDGEVIVGGSTSPLGWQAWRWTPTEGMVGLGDLPDGGFFSDAQAVSLDGTTIVGLGHSAEGSEAFRWTAAEGMVGLGDLPGGDHQSTAAAVSDDGSVIAGYGSSDAGTEAFVWTQRNGMIGLGDLPGGSFYSWADDISGDGSVIVGLASSAIGAEAFIWTEAEGMRSLRDVLTHDYGLDLSGWSLSGANGISADGRTIVGVGINPDGDFEGWVAVIPEPGTLSLLTIAIVACLRRRRDWGMPPMEGA